VDFVRGCGLWGLGSLQIKFKNTKKNSQLYAIHIYQKQGSDKHYKSFAKSGKIGYL